MALIHRTRGLFRPLYSQVALEDFKVIRPSYSYVLQNDQSCIDQLNKYKRSLSLETGLSAEVANIVKLFIEALNENVLKQRHLAEMSLAQKERTIPDFTISLIGRTKAGKSTLYDSEESNIPERHVLRKKFWSQAVPVLRERTKRFENVNPTVSNWLSTYVGRTGINISAVANFDLMKVELYIGTKDPELNDRIFEYIFAQKEEIENSAQSEFHWINESDLQHARIGIENSSLGLIDAELWDESIDFLANGVNKIADHILPKLESFYEEHS